MATNLSRISLQNADITLNSNPLYLKDSSPEIYQDFTSTNLSLASYTINPDITKLLHDTSFIRAAEDKLGAFTAIDIHVTESKELFVRLPGASNYDKITVESDTIDPILISIIAKTQAAYARLSSSLPPSPPLSPMSLSPRSVSSQPEAVEALEREVEALNAHTSHLEQKLREAEQTSSGELTELSIAHDNLLVALDEKEAQIRELQGRMKQLQSEAPSKEELKSLTAMESEVGRLTSILHNLEELLLPSDSLARELNTHSFEDLVGLAHHSLDEIAVARALLEEEREKVAALQQENLDLKESSVELSRAPQLDESVYDEKLQELEAALAQAQRTFEERREKLRERLADARREIESLQVERDDARAASSSMEKQSEKLERQVERLSQKNKGTQDTLDIYLLERNDLINRNSKLRSDIQALTRRGNALQKRLDESQELIQGLESHLSEEVTAKERAHKEREAIQAELSAIENDLREKERQLQLLKAENQDLRNLVGDLLGLDLTLSTPSVRELKAEATRWIDSRKVEEAQFASMAQTLKKTETALSAATSQASLAQTEMVELQERLRNLQVPDVTPPAPTTSSELEATRQMGHFLSMLASGLTEGDTISLTLTGREAAKRRQTLEANLKYRDKLIANELPDSFERIRAREVSAHNSAFVQKGITTKLNNVELFSEFTQVAKYMESILDDAAYQELQEVNEALSDLTRSLLKDQQQLQELGTISPERETVIQETLSRIQALKLRKQELTPYLFVLFLDKIHAASTGRGMSRFESFGPIALCWKKILSDLHPSFYEGEASENGFIRDFSKAEELRQTIELLSDSFNTLLKHIDLSA